MIFVIESIKGVKVNCPPNAYREKLVVGRYTVHAIFIPDNGYTFHIFRGDVLKAIISEDGGWYISKVDGECQNLLNRLLKIYG